MKRNMMFVIVAAFASTVFAQRGPGGLPMPHQILFSGYLVKYPKGVNQATLQRYIPELKCGPFEDEVICSSAADTLSSLFLRGVQCISSKEMAFSLKKDRTVGGSCQVTQNTAADLAISYRQKYGPPKEEKNQIYSMIVDRQTWKTGADVLTIAHFYGSDIHGEAIDNFSVHVSALGN